MIEFSFLNNFDLFMSENLILFIVKDVLRAKTSDSLQIWNFEFSIGQKNTSFRFV
jgi:hypothetical protein